MPGLYYEQLTAGLVIEHSIRRTVSEYDNILFSAMTHNCAPLHLDEEYAKTTMYGRRIVNSLYTLGLVCGIMVGETTQGTTLGNLGFDKIIFPKLSPSLLRRPKASLYSRLGTVITELAMAETSRRVDFWELTICDRCCALPP